MDICIVLDLDGTLIDAVDDCDFIFQKSTQNFTSENCDDWCDNYSDSDNEQNSEDPLNCENIVFESLEGEEIMMKIAKRPGFSEFIEYCFNNFEVGVWSMATPNYVKSVVSMFKHEPKFVFDRDKCDREKTKMYKNLDLIPHHGTVIMIDDSPKVIRKTKDSIIFKKIKTWKCDPLDNELFLLRKELDALSNFSRK